MIVYEKRLWLDGCASDALILLLIVTLLCGGVAVLIKTLRNHLGARQADGQADPGRELTSGKATGLYWYALVAPVVLIGVVLAETFFGIFPPEIVRIAHLGSDIELRRCQGFFGGLARYPLGDVALSYEREERGTARRVHHMLVIQQKSTGTRLGAVEFVPADRFNFPELEKLAPAAVAEFRRASSK
jgi:hypothetical protein